MVRFLLSIAFALLANAIGLIVAALVLDDMSLDGAAFIIAVAIFTAVEVIVQPLITSIGLQHARALAGSSALLATFVSLVVTTILSDGLRISGAVTWVLATVIVWLVSMLGGILIPALLVKRAVTADGTYGPRSRR